jgi:hypothetical protein
VAATPDGDGKLLAVGEIDRTNDIGTVQTSPRDH